MSTAPLTQSTEARSRRVAITSAAAPETTHFVTSVGSLGRAPACVDAVGGRLEGPAMQKWPKRTGCESTGRLSQGGEGADARASSGDAEVRWCASRTRLAEVAEVLVHNKLFFSPKFNNSNKKSPLVPL